MTVERAKCVRANSGHYNQYPQNSPSTTEHWHFHRHRNRFMNTDFCPALPLKTNKGWLSIWINVDQWQSHSVSSFLFPQALQTDWLVICISILPTPPPLLSSRSSSLLPLPLNRADGERRPFPKLLSNGLTVPYGGDRAQYLSSKSVQSYSEWTRLGVN